MIASKVACRSLSTPLPPSAWTSRPVEIIQRLLCNLAAILPPCGIEVNGRGEPSSLDRAADPPGDRGEEHEQDAEEHEPGARDLGKRPQKDGEPDGRDQPQQRDGHHRVVPGPHPDVAEHGPPSADGLRIVEPPELHREGDVSAAPERAEAEGHDGDGDATQEDVRVPGADGAVPAGRQGVSNHHELLLQQREETHREGEHEGNLVVEPALIHRHAPVEGIGGHREHDERDAHGREPERHEQAGVPPGRGDRDDAEQARVEVGRAVGEQMDQDDGRHQWKEEEDEHEVLQRADAAEDPDDRDDHQGHHPGVGQEERRDQKADDEDELGARVEAVEERVASRELVEELHADKRRRMASRASGTVMGRGSSPRASPRRATGGGLIAEIRSSSTRENTWRGGPSSSTRPSCMTITQRAYSATSSMTWVIVRIVMPWSWFSRARRSMISRERAISWPVVGSSTIRICGRITMMAAIASRWRSPLESWKGWSSRLSHSSSRRRPCSTASWIWWGEAPRFWRPNATSPQTRSRNSWWSGF